MSLHRSYAEPNVASERCHHCRGGFGVSVPLEGKLFLSGHEDILTRDNLFHTRMPINWGKPKGCSGFWRFAKLQEKSHTNGHILEILRSASLWFDASILYSQKPRNAEQTSRPQLFSSVLLRDVFKFLGRDASGYGVGLGSVATRSLTPQRDAALTSGWR